MRGKVKYVTRNVWTVEAQDSVGRHDSHGIRYTNTYAVLYPDNDGDVIEVYIDEDDIRIYYDRTNITSGLIHELSDDLHNEWIEYYVDEDGGYSLDGNLYDYL